METTSIDDPDARAQDMLIAAEENFISIMNSLTVIRRKLEDGDCDIPEAEIRRTLGSVHRAIQAVFDERKRLDDIQRSCERIVRDDAIDMRAAEQEIRRRLARIRAELDGSGVSGVD